MKLVNINDAEKVIVLPNKDGEYVLGRRSNADIRINDKNVSSQHAQIIISQGQVEIIDLGSSNGTKINGKTIKKGILNHGDFVQFGGVKFKIEGEIRKPAIKTKPHSEVKAKPKQRVKKEVVVEEDKIFEEEKKPKAKKNRPISRKSADRPGSEEHEEKAAKQDNSILWMVIFFTGIFLGVILIILGIIINSSANSERDRLQEEITKLENSLRDVTNNLRFQKKKLKDISEQLNTLNDYLDKSSSNINDKSRTLISRLKEIQDSRDVIKKKIQNMEDEINEMQDKIDRINED